MPTVSEVFVPLLSKMKSLYSRLYNHKDCKIPKLYDQSLEDDNRGNPFVTRWFRYFIIVIVHTQCVWVTWINQSGGNPAERCRHESESIHYLRSNLCAPASELCWFTATTASWPDLSLISIFALMIHYLLTTFTGILQRLVKYDLSFVPLYVTSGGAQPWMFKLSILLYMFAFIALQINKFLMK